MAKSTKRKAIRTRGNNLKKTVRRGRKLNRAVNNVKATKKRRKSRSRRTSRKVRKSLNLNQSGGRAGTAQQAIDLFNRILGPGLYSKISQTPRIISKEGVDEKGKHFIILYNTSTFKAVKFRYYYLNCLIRNEALKYYYYNPPAPYSISGGYPVVLLQSGEKSPIIFNLSKNTRVTQTPDGSANSKAVLTEVLRHIGITVDIAGTISVSGVEQAKGAPEVPERQLFIVPNETGGNLVLGNQESGSLYEMPVVHTSKEAADTAFAETDGDSCPRQEDKYVYSEDVSGLGAAAAAEPIEDPPKLKRLVELSIAEAAKASEPVYMNVATDTKNIIYKMDNDYFLVPIEGDKGTTTQTITFTNTVGGTETTTDVTYAVVSRA